MSTSTPFQRWAQSASGWFLILGLSCQVASGATFDIPSQLAPSAFQTFIRQSGCDVFFGVEEVRGVKTNAVKGEHDPATALQLMLEQTGLIASTPGPKKFVVASSKLEKTGAIEGSLREDRTGRPIPEARVSVLGTGIATMSDRRGNFVFEDVGPGAYTLGISADGMQNTRVTDVTVGPGRRTTLSAVSIPARLASVVQLDDYIVSAKKNDGVIELDPYSVEGRRARPFSDASVDLPRTIDDIQPYYIFDARTIDQSGASNVEDFLKQRLTMNGTVQTNSQISGSNSLANTSSINLRGLGADKTLILVNGRRVAGVSILGTDYQPDLNGIPVSSIERVEVLPSSASGIYGGSAIGGVINVILKRTYSGGEIRATYGNTWDSVQPTRTLSASYGFTAEGGKTRVMMNASWADASSLVLRDRREIYEKNVATILKNFPGVFYNAANPFLGALPNIYSGVAGAKTSAYLSNRHCGGIPK